MNNQQKATWLASCSHFITHGFMTLFPAVMVVIAGENSMSFMAIGLIANGGYFLYGLGAFPAGYLADRYGSKRVLTIGVLGMSVASILVGMSVGVWTFAAAYALLGIFASIHHPAGLSLIARRVTEQKGKALGLHGVMGNVGLFMTPLFAASCIWAFDSWRSSYILYGLIGFGFTLMLYKARLPEEPDLSLKALFGKKVEPSLPDEAPAGCCAADLDREKGDAEVDKHKSKIILIPISLLLLYVGSVLSGYIFRGSLTFFPVLFRQEVLFITNHDEPVVMAGFLTTAVLTLGLVGAWFGGYINDKLKKPEFFPAIIFILVAPILYLISRYSDNRLIVMSAMFSLIYYAWQPAQNYLIAKYTKKASHGMGFGVNFFLIFGIGSVATATGGYVTDDYGVDLFYWILSLVAGAAIISSLAVYFFRKYHLRFLCKLEKE